MEDKDCYIFLDMDLDKEESKRTPKHLCVPCRNKVRPGEGFFWPAQGKYGPWDFKCATCGTYLHKAEEDEEEDGED